MSEARKYTVKILVKYIKMDVLIKHLLEPIVKCTKNSLL